MGLYGKASMRGGGRRHGAFEAKRVDEKGKKRKWRVRGEVLSAAS
jgi:hypothetical protein